nr:DUF2089 domain-containing protein [Petrachloros mirabilis]
MLVPVIVLIGFRWWVHRNVLQAPCPVCQAQLIGLKKTSTQCPSCGTTLQVVEGQFQRLSAPGTIDVDAVDVTVQVLED